MRSHAGTLSGTGRLHVRGEAVGMVGYHIDIYCDGEVVTGMGAVTGTCMVSVKEDAGGEAILELKDGEMVKVLLSRVNAEGARVKTIGDVPGF